MQLKNCIFALIVSNILISFAPIYLICVTHVIDNTNLLRKINWFFQWARNRKTNWKCSNIFEYINGKFLSFFCVYCNYGAFVCVCRYVAVRRAFRYECNDIQSAETKLQKTNKKKVVMARTHSHTYTPSHAHRQRVFERRIASQQADETVYQSINHKDRISCFFPFLM